ncbi:iron complex transport system substrate-binding protein [Neobacillus niacini]|uniref:ABC transporter substrate-binding protein n=1 Tax=Neobacillus niacini TaxID=86668 RepID=UPI0028556272|nr:ABC transporter substrate-binding protein [Neobacillus niacini]MDR7077580.1 iron complex transport system substrate-binding protein [Neobacillus niacini]
MKKLSTLLFLLMLTIGVLAACGEQKEQVKDKSNGNSSKTEETAFPVTIKDALDNDITIKEKPEKIVSLIPSNTEIAFALGLGDEIVGVSNFDNYPKEVSTKEKIGDLNVNIEKVISLQPNLVLAHASTDLGEGLQQLKDSGLTVLVVNDAQTFDQVFDSIAMIGKATGATKEADDLIKDMQTKLAEIKDKAAKISEKKKVLVEVSGAPDIFTTGKNTFMDDMISIINAENIANDQEGWIKIDEEAMITRNPDVIITTYGFYDDKAVENVLSRVGWENVNAIKNKQVIDVDSDRVTRSGPRIVEGVEELAKAVYPEVFK